MTDESARRKLVQDYETAYVHFVAASLGADVGVPLNVLRDRIYDADTEISKHCPEVRSTAMYGF
jgi:hypothetical protein